MVLSPGNPGLNVGAETAVLHNNSASGCQHDYFIRAGKTGPHRARFGMTRDFSTCQQRHTRRHKRRRDPPPPIYFFMQKDSRRNRVSDEGEGSGGGGDQAYVSP